MYNNAPHAFLWSKRAAWESSSQWQPICADELIDNFYRTAIISAGLKVPPDYDAGDKRHLTDKALDRCSTDD